MASSKIQQSVLIEHPYQQQNETTTTKWNNYNTMKQLQQNETTTTKWNNYNKMKQLQQNETTTTKRLTSCFTFIEISEISFI